MARNKKPTGILKNTEQNEESTLRNIETKDLIQDIIIACEDLSSAPVYFKEIMENLKRERVITHDSLVIAKHHNTHPTGVLEDLKSHVISGLKKKNPTLFAELDKEKIKTEKYTKLIFSELLQKQSIAIRNAEKLLLSHGEDHNPECNSSTTIHELIKVLNSLNKNILTYETEFCRVEYRKEHNAILCTWKKFCQGDDYRDPLLHGLSILKDTECKTWITDTRDGFKNQKDDTTWLVHNFTPQVLATSCTNLYFIMEDGSTIEEEIKVQSEVLSSSFNVVTYKTLEEIELSITSKDA